LFVKFESQLIICVFVMLCDDNSKLHKKGIKKTKNRKLTLFIFLLYFIVFTFLFVNGMFFHVSYNYLQSNLIDMLHFLCYKFFCVW